MQRNATQRRDPPTTPPCLHKNKGQTQIQNPLPHSYYPALDRSLNYCFMLAFIRTTSLSLGQGLNLLNLQRRNLIHVIQPATPHLLFLQPVIRPQHKMALDQIHKRLCILFT